MCEESCSDTIKVAKRSSVSCNDKLEVSTIGQGEQRRITLRKGLPHFVVFIIRNDVCRSVLGMVAKITGNNKKKKYVERASCTEMDE